MIDVVRASELRLKGKAETPLGLDARKTARLFGKGGAERKQFNALSKFSRCSLKIG